MTELNFLESLIEAKPDAFLSEMKEALDNEFGTYSSLDTISRELYRRGFSRKKVTKPALERDEEMCANYRLNVGLNYCVDQLVFVDETGCNRNTTMRNYGWAPCGDCSRRRDFFIRGQKYSILPALSLEGILHVDVQTNSYTSETFNNFIEGVIRRMNPFPQMNSVLVMDNVSGHTSKSRPPTKKYQETTSLESGASATTDNDSEDIVKVWS